MPATVCVSAFDSSALGGASPIKAEQAHRADAFRVPAAAGTIAFCARDTTENLYTHCYDKVVSDASRTVLFQQEDQQGVDSYLAS